MKLRIVKGNNPGQLLNLDGKDSFLIGRVEDNDFIINEAGVSRHHCKLSNVAGEWLAEDLNSVNGLLVNGSKISGGVILHPGDEITVFSHTFVLEDDSSPNALSLGAASGGLQDGGEGQPNDAPNYLDDNYSKDAPEDFDSPKKRINAALIAKVVVLLLISAAIVALLIMLNDKPQDTGEATEQPTVEAPAKEEPKKEEGAQQHVARGESLLVETPNGTAAAPAGTSNAAGHQSVCPLISLFINLFINQL